MRANIRSLRGARVYKVATRCACILDGYEVRVYLKHQISFVIQLRVSHIFMRCTSENFSHGIRFSFAQSTFIYLLAWGMAVRVWSGEDKLVVSSHRHVWVR